LIIGRDSGIERLWGLAFFRSVGNMPRGSEKYFRPKLPHISDFSEPHCPSSPIIRKNP
jgi:hypothetical protein